MEILIVLSGPIGVGKSSFAKALNELFDVQRISTRAWILENTGCENERRSLQNAGDRLDAETGGAWVSDAVAAAIDAGLSGPRLLLDSARISGQVAALRERYGA